jgi:hypothetical protein
MNNFIPALKILFGLLFVWMCYTFIHTSVENNLFKQWEFLRSIPLIRLTLWDFYTNVTVIFLWVCYKENKLSTRLLWLMLLVTSGGVASCAYVLIQLFKLHPGQGLKEFFGKQNV